MAHIHEQTVVIRLSKLVKDANNAADLAPEGLTDQVEAVVSELIGDESIIVEVERLD